MKKLAFLVIILATVVMFYRINRYPISFSIYEGLSGLTASKIIEGDQGIIQRVWEKPIRNQAGCSAGIGSADNDIFFIFPTVLFMELFGCGDNYLTLRLTSMIYGILSVWVLYLLGAKLFNRGVGVIAAFFLATSSWALVYSRISYDVSATILFALLCFYLYAAIDRPNNPIGYMILGGLMGLATYFYVPVRIIFPLVLANMILRMIFERGYFRSHYQYFILMIACFILSLHFQGGDLSTYFVKNVPLSFMAWSKNSDMWSQLSMNIMSAYKGFFVEWGWSHSIIAERGGSFDFITGYCFLAGFIWAVLHITKQQYRLVIIWVAAVMLPMVLTSGVTRRAVLATTPIYLIAAIGIYYLFYYLTKWMGRFREIVMAILVLAVIIPAGYLNLQNYFGLYEKAYRDPRNVFVKRRDQRAELVRLMKDSKVYSDLFRAELGWPQGIEYEAWRIGFTKDRYELISPDQARKKFIQSMPPCALYLKNGELQVKEIPDTPQKRSNNP